MSKVKNEADSTADVKKLSSYMHDNYGAAGFQTPWYSLIKSYRITSSENGKEVSVYTSIYPDADGKQAAMDVANAVVFNNAVEVYDVTVYGVNNTPLAYKSK
ncbi:hypothetical protein AAC03nite_20100 [Alicyclobacillus acidoterrestris]|nr:hypothetical protein AAC03nite_20100 [Alicyclobacillus acidoterrestris]